jgi:hypothetical protein
MSPLVGILYTAVLSSTEVKPFKLVASGMVIHRFQCMPINYVKSDLRSQINHCSYLRRFSQNY